MNYGKAYSSVSYDGFNKEEIHEILASGNVERIRNLSRFLIRFSGQYARAIQYYSTLLQYSYILVPHYDVEKPPKSLKKEYNQNLSFIRKINLNYILPQINYEILTNGVYYGLLREDENGNPFLYTLPLRYCRTNFNDENGLPILELNYLYFTEITSDENVRKKILSLFPKYVKNNYYNKKLITPWVEIPPSQGGICFFFSKDLIPPFISGASSIVDLQNAKDIELKRDQRELEKILIHKMPIEKEEGRLLISLEEASELHNGICNMLGDDDSIDIITTYGDIHLENVQDSSNAATASTNRINKYNDAVYDELGISSQLFNAGTSATSQKNATKKDIQIMTSWSQQYEVWFNALLKRRSKNKNLFFSIKFFPTSILYKQDDLDMYLKTAQYGFPKSIVASIMGMDTEELMQMSDFESNILNIQENMQPLKSSYTTSNKDDGRPQMTDTQKSDKTLANIDGAS